MIKNCGLYIEVVLLHKWSLRQVPLYYTSVQEYMERNVIYPDLS